MNDAMHKYQLPPYLQFAEPYYAGKDPAYNFQHIQRILGRLTWLSGTLHIFEHQILERVEFQTPAGRLYAQKMRPCTKAFPQQLKAELFPKVSPS